MKREIIAVRNFIVMEFKKDEAISLHLPEGSGPADGLGNMEVVCVGPDCISGIQKGDWVIAHPKEVIKYQHNNTMYYYVSEEHVRAVIREAGQQ